MKRIGLLALLGLMLFVVFVLYQLPATYLTSRLPTNFAVQGVQGTIWQGEAAQLSVNGRALGKLNWQWQFSPLYSGQWGYLLTLSGDAINGHTQAAVGLDQQLTLTQTEMTIAGDYLNSLVRSRQNIGLFGQFDIDSPLMSIAQGWPVDGSAKIIWRDARLVGDLPMRLGELVAAVDVVDGELIADLQDEGGPLELDGQAKLQRSLAYQVDMQVRARASAGQNLATSLSLIGPPDVTGRYRLTHTGRFN